MNRIYRVYEYIRPDDNSCFYVGCGKGIRPYDLNARSKEFKAIIEELRLKQLQPIVKIVWTYQMITENPYLNFIFIKIRNLR
jgi:hypothetical protein